MRAPSFKHVIVGAVSASLFVVALVDGGFYPKAIAAIAAVSWGLVSIGVTSRALPSRRIPADAGVAVIALLLLAALSAISMAWSPDPGQAFEETVRVAGYVGVFALALLLGRRSGASGMLVGITIAMIAVCALALGGRLLEGLPNDRAVAEALGAEGQLSYPIGYWNGLAALAALGLVGSLWVATYAHSARSRALAVGVIPLGALVIFLAESRGAMLAAAVGVLTVLVLAASERRGAAVGAVLAGAVGGAALIVASGELEAVRSGIEGSDAQRQKIAMLGWVLVAGAGSAALAPVAGRLAGGLRLARPVWVGLAALLVVGFVALGPDQVVGGFQEPSVEEDSRAITRLTSGTGRYQYWQAALEAFGEEPLAGIGAGGYESWWNERGDLPQLTRFAHSLPLETAAELGVGGLLALGGFFSVCLLTGTRRARSGSIHAGGAVALVATGLAMSLLEWTWEIPAATLPVLLAAAVAVGPATARAGETAPAAARIRSAARALGLSGGGAGRASVRPVPVAVLVSAAPALLAAAVLWSVDARLEAGDRALEAGRLDRAARQVRAAALLVPWDAEPRRRLASIERDAGNIDAATMELDAAIERAPRDWTLWALAAALRDDAGDEEGSVTALGRALELAPPPPDRSPSNSP